MIPKRVIWSQYSNFKLKRHLEGIFGKRRKSIKRGIKWRMYLDHFEAKYTHFTPFHTILHILPLTPFLTHTYLFP